MDPIDRIAPTRRPEGRRVAQHQTWETLLFLHWRVPVAALRPLIPAALELDTFDGDAWVGLVPFTMRGVRLAWLPAVPGTADFHETNLRTYVHHRGAQPGVWFFTLEAAAWLPVQVARIGWHLPYHHARMSLTRGDDGVIDYVTERRDSPTPARCAVRYEPVGAPAPAAPGTLEHFLAERYLLYADTGGGRIQRGQVHHTPYPLQRAKVHAWDETIFAACGIARPAVEPIAHYASGVEVEIFDLEDIPG
jgi:uncharacterized protein YqjF (DUF2071 family)